ncbi:hypothetical protein LIER_28511 [Lithospermum erythrorhizon]|uniref:Uncharacterized protein n=1 Tax=Lithospermum erythrorhizon TaxID=34254 RepID=A0AAV3RFY7_LITER
MSGYVIVCVYYDYATFYFAPRNLEFGQSKIHSEICLDKYEVFGSEQSSKTFTEVDNKCSEARTIGVRSGESRRGKGTSWKTPPDMIHTLRNDPEFCLSAVCALYRQHISAGKSTDNIGFRFCDIASGTEAAKYLINDDPTNNLSRSVSEVEQERPSTLETCWKLAIKYLKQLFDMYQKKLDPLFCQEA